MSSHLLPVSDGELSPALTSSMSSIPPSRNLSSTSKNPSASSILPSQFRLNRACRPLSPSSLRGVDLNHLPRVPHRKYADPLSGHNLMAMFPPAPPEISPDLARPISTSRYFQREERDFFAQSGREIVRVRLEVDIQNGVDAENTTAKVRNSTLQTCRVTEVSALGRAPHHSPIQFTPAPVLYPDPPSPRPLPRGTTSVTSAPLSPVPSHSPFLQHPPNLHPPALRTPPHRNTEPGVSKNKFPSDECGSDETWRRPIPPAERRRAGKHTRRIIVET